MLKESPSSQSLIAVVLVAFGVVGVVFLPLGLAAVEGGLFGSRHVEEFFQTIGIGEALGEIYRPIVRQLRP